MSTSNACKILLADHIRSLVNAPEFHWSSQKERCLYYCTPDGVLALQRLLNENAITAGTLRHIELLMFKKINSPEQLNRSLTVKNFYRLLAHLTYFQTDFYASITLAFAKLISPDLLLNTSQCDEIIRCCKQLTITNLLKKSASIVNKAAAKADSGNTNEALHLLGYKSSLRSYVAKGKTHKLFRSSP